MWGILLALAGVSPQVEILHTPADAVVFAAADASTIDERRRIYTRYVWIPDADKKTLQAVSYVVNATWSKASIVVPIRSVAAGHLVRIQLDTLLPKDADLRRAVELWEKQAGQDPYFYVKAQKKVAAYKADDGKTYDFVWATAFGGHVPLEAGVMLQGLTRSTAPVQRFDRFLIKSLTQIDGGIYYDLVGIRKSQKEGRTDFQQFALDHGVDEEFADKLNAERRAAIFKSGVTGKPRAIEEIQGLFGTFAYTNDLADNNLDPNAHPILTLLDPKFDASEVIALKSNGLCDFALFDGKGKLADAVPDNITKDHTIPAPYTARLQPGISCIRCHATGKGFRSTRNDVATLLKTKDEDGFKFDILGQGTARDALDKIASAYRGNLKRLDRGREDYSDAVFLATGGMSVEQVSGEVKRIDDSYRHADVTPEIACKELGIDPQKKSVVETLRSLLKPIQYEDARIGFLKSGVSITRPDWEQVYIDAATRSRPEYDRLAKEQVSK